MGYVIGVVLLSVSALLWVILLIGAGDSDDPVSMLLGGVLLTVLPIWLGASLVRRRRGEAPTGDAGEASGAGEEHWPGQATATASATPAARAGAPAPVASPASTTPGRMWLPHPLWLAAALIVVLLAGGAAAFTRTPPFPGLWLLGAVLSPLAALAFAARRLDFAMSFGRLCAALAIGAVLSVPLAIVIEVAAPLLIIAIVLPLREAAADLLRNASLERFFYSRTLVIALIHAAIVAPLAEEAVKPLGALLLARRLRSRSEAFLVGMAGGLAFAAIENLLYQSFGGRAWPGIAAVRSIGGVLHPLTAGMLGVAWFELRRGMPGAGARWFGTFALAVALHAAWNGGIVLLAGALGTYYFETRTWRLSIFDAGLPVALLALLTLLSLLMWRILWIVTDMLRGGREAVAPRGVAGPRALAAFGLSLLAVAVPIGALATPFVLDYLPHVLRAGA